MKNNLAIILLAISPLVYGQIPTPIVSAPILEGFAAENFAWETSDRVRTQLATVVTTMGGVQTFIGRANQVSCTIDIFNNHIDLAQQYGFYNCQLDNRSNNIGNDLMMVMDVANSAMSALFIAEPQDRLEQIDRAVDKYVQLDSEMWDVINWIYDEVAKRKKKQEEIHEVEKLSGIPLLPTEITGHPIIIPDASADLNSVSSNVSNFRSGSAQTYPSSFSFSSGFTSKYAILDVLLKLAMAIGLVTVVWAYAWNKPNPHVYAVGFLIAVVLGNILRVIFFV